MSMFKKKRLQTGLDIGSFSIKFVQLSGDHSSPLLVNFDVIKVEDRIDEQKKVLKGIAKKLTSKEVNISISGPSVVVRYIEIPKMTDEELKSSMKFEASKYIPFDLNDVILDCQTVEHMNHGKMRVLVIAAKKEAITKRLGLVEGAGLSVRIIDCDSFALMNAFLLNFPDVDEGATIALLNLGQGLTAINILRGKRAHFTRELQLGGHGFIKAISERLNLDMKAASELIEHPEERFKEILEIVKPIIAHMIEEIKLSLSYYENQVGAAVDRIYLSGGLSSFKGLVDIFGEGIGVDCKLWDPLKRLKIDKDVEQERLNNVKNQLSVALGLAIRG